MATRGKKPQQNRRSMDRAPPASTEHIEIKLKTDFPSLRNSKIKSEIIRAETSHHLSRREGGLALIGAWQKAIYELKTKEEINYALSIIAGVTKELLTEESVKRKVYPYRFRRKNP